ncbi:hypothetical protein HK097_010733 [Rhizophlyctis rosea]|uniref:DNA/RNA-binding protein Kin17 WH-like domain-containing protein n=1 Tax=Rhizophlyctis rosea TaxID=64517 RepID=A0AAD5S8V2_9FUNG|nr:hypothetical protein HK097_010733 [Rhizophlyctis rosea]
MCEKQCRDENGFKCHCASEAHQRQMALFAESSDKYLNNFSKEFQDDFVKLLARRYGTRRVHANLVYQEYISDRNHLHMNATHWNSLTEFAMHLGKQGICEVEETPKGWFIKWIDRSPETLRKQEAIKKQERLERSEEERAEKLLKEQIEKAKEVAANAEAEYTELKREGEGEPIKLQLKTLAPTKMAFKKPEPKKLNALAMASKKAAEGSKPSLAGPGSSSSSGAPMGGGASSGLGSAGGSKLSAAELIIKEEMDRKRKAPAGFSRPDDKRRR